MIAQLLAFWFSPPVLSGLFAGLALGLCALGLRELRHALQQP